MIKLSDHEVWFITGSQHLYGEETLKNVAKHSEEIAKYLNDSREIPVDVVHKPIVTTPEQIATVCREANVTDRCVGIVVWMHTFSPAKMWIKGLQLLNKPMCHLHTQYNSEIPWKEIDMDFMNENQSAHGGREFGFMAGRLRKNRKVVTGHWKDENVHQKLGIWSRVAVGWHILQTAKIARIGDNMRQVAVTEGDKVEAQMRFGFSVNGYGIGDIVEYLNAVTDKETDALVAIYKEQYRTDSPSFNENAVKDAARIELGLRAFLEEGGFGGFTNTFEDLHGFKQLPGIPTQRLMADGYGYGGEGDWKTAALLHAVKVMTQGLEGGTSFMEDYTYDFRKDGSRVLGSHMLEICPSIASEKPKLEVHPLSIGGKEDPARLVFNVGAGPAINVALMDMGNRFRLVVNEVRTVEPDHDLPKLPVARALWKPEPDLETAASAWILAGGSHHTVYSKAATTEFMEDLAEMAGVELLTIDNNTVVRDFKEKLRWNEVYYHLFQNNM
ncbi:L-arabinose isomerase [Sinomicrobium weinanense]|uniref:L-arabinose isomerase n=1 Tax=Sinomicrobium weinanense TaxID=2842200 RepID=A0A926JS29_9FLAO|nr:L-arabinose isomerase [Sinomicrobium weinanense]MBC9796351.1 L-arabinose isomerase [Sinomicrobium weinanense]MBU3122447.1 L-arabinose isomerase [Sinomicrobium weinanense]